MASSEAIDVFPRLCGVEGEFIWGNTNYRAVFLVELEDFEVLTTTEGPPGKRCVGDGAKKRTREFAERVGEIGIYTVHEKHYCLDRVSFPTV